MTIIAAPSPNFDERARPIDMIVLHYTGMPDGPAALARLCDPEAKVSAHYMVELNGDIFRLVEEDKRAWHAGLASWKGESDINARSVGVEIVNPGHEFGYAAFPSAQVDAVLGLVGEIAARHGVHRSMVLGHSDVAPRRKEDPGELFPWARLAENGLALGVFDGEGDASIDYREAATALRDIGYDAPDGDHGAGLLAFQRRFCPNALGQGFNPVTKAALLWAREASLA